LLKTQSFLNFQIDQIKEHQIIAKPFFPIFPHPCSTKEPKDEAKIGGGMITNPSQLIKPYHTLQEKGQCRNKWQVDSTYKSQKIHLESAKLNTFLLLRLSLVGILFNNNCQAKALTFDGTPLFQINLKAKDSKEDLGVLMLSVLSRRT
jgi:hypothetical protein